MSRPVIERLHVISTARLRLRCQRIDSVFCAGQQILGIAYRMFIMKRPFACMLGIVGREGRDGVVGRKGRKERREGTLQKKYYYSLDRTIGQATM
jgi:hypothetical protein